MPTFCSLMVYYNPLVITFDELSTKLRSKLRDVGEADLSIRKIVPIPVCYGGRVRPLTWRTWRNWQAFPKTK